jgi:2-oxoglutarate ferredoxin oxidoreductase subunit alpha
LNPFPGKALEKFLKDKIEGIKNNAETSSNLRVKTVIIEMNYMSQLDLLIKQNTNLKADCNILKYNGRPMSNTEIYDSLLNIIQNKSKQRVILTNGV